MGSCTYPSSFSAGCRCLLRYFCCFSVIHSITRETGLGGESSCWGFASLFFALFGFGMRAVAESRIYDARVITFEMRIQQALGFMGEVGVALSVLAPQAFVICALCHRDVAATFQREITERSNQAMQRTAPRSDA